MSILTSSVLSADGPRPRYAEIYHARRMGTTRSPADQDRVLVVGGGVLDPSTLSQDLVSSGVIVIDVVERRFAGPVTVKLLITQLAVVVRRSNQASCRMQPLKGPAPLVVPPHQSNCSRTVPVSVSVSVSLSASAQEPKPHGRKNRPPPDQVIPYLMYASSNRKAAQHPRRHAYMIHTSPHRSFERVTRRTSRTCRNRAALATASQ